MKIKFTLLPGATAPTYATDGSAGMDLYANHEAWIYAGDVTYVHTGVCVEIPIGFGLLILPRSGKSIEGFVIANSPGLIDSDYRGEINVLMRMMSGRISTSMTLVAGDRIAQMVLVAMPRIELEQVESLSPTARGDGGFGSTGA